MEIPTQHPQPPGKIGEALVVGHGIGVIWMLSHLLFRSGLAADVITTSSLIRFSHYAHSVRTVASHGELAVSARASILSRAYDWVIAVDDDTLSALADFDWRSGERAAYLPVWSEKHRRHLHSKVGLSQVFAASGIRTPAFRVANNCTEAISAAHELGYPILLKVDASGGGNGVFECKNQSEICGHANLFGTAPLLVQKKIFGVELDLSAIYFEEQLVHFTFSTIERSIRPFGVSVVRRYFPLALVTAETFEELSLIGQSTGASGFVTISCIDASDGSGRYYFEADMRPNVWVDFSRFIDEDAAPRIRNWFARRERLTRASGGFSITASRPMIIPYFLRLRIFELLINRYRVWNFIPWADRSLIRRLVLAKVARNVVSITRPIVPPQLRPAIKSFLASIGLAIE